MSGPAGVRRVLAVLSGVVVVALTAAASRVPWSATDPGIAMLRLSWRAPAMMLETCEPLAPGRGGQIPEHMRGAQLCEGEGIPWSLDVRVDGAAAVRDTIEPAGIRGDRPLYVLRTVTVEPGTHALAVSFRPLFPAGEEVADSLARRAFALETTVDLGEREVLLVTIDPERGELVTREPVGRR